ncbi:homeobox-leucine zipper protein HAT5-like isoform X1 [Mangifera indica]|uniref:homeobox-leucine zipper protein HAT5-like isoform X1 n=1 Tax=Mangifera indica TaxID=29780 RepID=UPI001CFC2413|nr:homeobox-leucine zipper protein HAT5-like isoform X1 [Mangifera indica]
MESGRIFFNPSVACHGNMFFLGKGDSLFRGATSMMSIEDSSKRRPFFTSPDDLFDDCYYDEQSPEKKRRLSAEQVNLLEKSFEEENKLEPERKIQLAKKLGLQPRQVAVWFQNRRARWKTKQLERDYDLLKASYDALLSNYDTIFKENENLKSQVVSLTEKLGETEENNKEGKKNEAVATEMAQVLVAQLSNKTEDGVSSGSGGSAVVDEDYPQIVESGDSISYFPNDEYTGCIGAIEGVQSEEDDGSDDGQSYFLDVFLGAQNQQAEEPLEWWMWPS